MKITEATKISEILQAYPWIKDELAKVDDKFKILQTPVGAMMAAKASIADVCGKVGIDSDAVIKKVEELIAAHIS